MAEWDDTDGCWAEERDTVTSTLTWLHVCPERKKEIQESHVS